jgi:hypothetical protein
MKWILVACCLLNGCAVYTVASTTSLVTTDKSLADHALTQIVPYSDCGTFNLFKGLYYCEIQDPSKTYNQGTF